MSSLAKTLRPKAFIEMFGQQQITSNIRQMYANGRDPNAFLFSGETGSGKTTLARILAVALNCRHQKKAEAFGNPCDDCYKGRNKFGIHEVNAAHYNGVDAVKELALSSEFAPIPPSRKRILIMDEAQMLSRAAQNVLLKYFEDAPRTTTWMVCTTEPESIIAPLRGRCKAYALYPLVGAEAEKFVHWAAKRAHIKRDLSDFIDTVHSHGITSPRNILQALEKCADGLDPDVAVFGSESAIDTKRLCRALVAGEWKPVRAELEKATPADARLIKGSILGYLRSILLNPRPEAKLEIVAWAIDSVARTGFSDDRTAIAHLSSLCWQMAKKFPG